ncbi:hypothetical protein Dsin_009266 [Dipteronia sinensis]|uniref:Endonuclease/exonuclease/phosphatase domain-containing protein n=1 Tax=Dipteronia sinensis TaxID=43782 RepID=A0AAE0AQA9_9ROSI|nr:hypothetical protein Dsin_009266 [Dipteronia sinensis]
MIIFTWNARGLDNPRAFTILQTHKQELQSDIMFLMETKCKLNKLETWRVKLEFEGKLVVESVVQRFHSWALLRRLKGLSTLPWLCMGDFNEILCDSEKMGGNKKNWHQILNFREALDDCGLEEIGFVGPRVGMKNKVKRLYFEECWASYRECYNIVSASWLANIGGTITDVVLRNIESCGKRLADWNILRRRGMRRDISMYRADLKNACQKERPDLCAMINGLEAHLDDALHVEERYWCQRARVEWLKFGDRNTHFFFTLKLLYGGLEIKL